MASGGSGLELWLVLSGSAHVVIPKSRERVEKMMMNQSRCGMLLLVDQLRRDVEKWGAADVKHYKCREIKCAVLLEDDTHHSEIVSSFEEGYEKLHRESSKLR